MLTLLVLLAGAGLSVLIDASTGRPRVRYPGATEDWSPTGELTQVPAVDPVDHGPDLWQLPLADAELHREFDAIMAQLHDGLDKLPGGWPDPQPEWHFACGDWGLWDTAPEVVYA
jgi:hypothetical protein